MQCNTIVSKNCLFLSKPLLIECHYIQQFGRKNIFYNGREKIKSIFLIHNIINRKIITSKIFDFFKAVDEISIPEFPINGNYLLNHGIKSGKKIGELIKKFENQWIENDFNLDDEEIKTLIKKNI